MTELLLTTIAISCAVIAVVLSFGVGMFVSIKMIERTERRYDRKKKEK